MAFWKRRSRNFEPVSPETKYVVTYLGREPTQGQGKTGLDATLKPVDDMYKRFKLKKHKAPSRMMIEVVNNGIRMKSVDANMEKLFVNVPYCGANSVSGEVFFPIMKLSFGAVDPFHSKLFCFIARNENASEDGNWDCHAVLCESSAMAKNLTLYLVKAFQRLADSKENPMTATQRSRKATTIHILRERGTMEHQLIRKNKNKTPAVSTLKVTLNVEVKSEFESDRKQLEDNKRIADILAKHRSVSQGEMDDEGVVLSGGEETKEDDDVLSGGGGGTSAFDKENEIADDDGGDDGELFPDGDEEREIVVTIAVNPDLNSPPESPRKSVDGGGSGNSEDDEDVTFEEETQGATDGNTSPQAMITTMSPPDTPGYLPPEASTSLHELRESSKTTSPGDDVKTDDVTKNPSPPPTSSPASTSPSPPPAAVTATPEPLSKEEEKKLKRQKRKSVRFADDPEMIE